MLLDFELKLKIQVPNYHKIISHPMDFKTIRIKLVKNHFDKYQTVENFIKDVLLVFSNCATYNPVSPNCATFKLLEHAK